MFENREQDGIESLPSLTKTEDEKEEQNANITMLSLVPLQVQP